MSAQLERRMRAALQVGSGTAADLADRSRMSRSLARQVLNRLREQGEAERWKQPGTRAWIWRLTPRDERIRYDCPMHGSATRGGTCCARVREVKLPARPMASIPWAVRVDCRHLLQELHSRCLETRAALAVPDLDADGAVADLSAMISDLQEVRRKLQ